MPRRFEICVGDVSDAGEDRVDVLVVSAFPGDYSPTPGTVIQALLRRGVDVEALAARKAADWRALWHCWISEAVVPEASQDAGVPPAAGAAQGPGIGRILCFEHGVEDPAQRVGNVFRALSEHALTRGDRAPIGLVRLPVLATGNQHADAEAMLGALIRQSLLHLRGGLPTERIQLVLRDHRPEVLQRAVHAARIVERAEIEWVRPAPAGEREYDFFLSYRRQDEATVEELAGAMADLRPEVRLFRDIRDIPVGAFWKQELLTALSRSEHTICLVTDAYSDSGECMDEFHAALCLSLSGAHRVIPLLRLHHRSLDDLPATIRDIQGIDARTPPRSMTEVAAAVLG
jgi:hypothetical protein